MPITAESLWRQCRACSSSALKVTRPRWCLRQYVLPARPAIVDRYAHSLGHAGGGKACLEDLAAAGAAEPGHPSHSPQGLLKSLDKPPGDPVLQHFRYGTPAVGNHGRAARYGLDHHQAKWLWPINGEQ